MVKQSIDHFLLTDPHTPLKRLAESFERIILRRPRPHSERGSYYQEERECSGGGDLKFGSGQEYPNPRLIKLSSPERMNQCQETERFNLTQCQALAANLPRPIHRNLDSLIHFGPISKYCRWSPTTINDGISRGIRTGCPALIYR